MIESVIVYRTHKLRSTVNWRIVGNREIMAKVLVNVVTGKVGSGTNFTIGGFSSYDAGGGSPSRRHLPRVEGRMA